MQPLHLMKTWSQSKKTYSIFLNKGVVNHTNVNKSLSKLIQRRQCIHRQIQFQGTHDTNIKRPSFFLTILYSSSTIVTLVPLSLSYGNFFPLVKRRHILAKRWKIRLLICYFETITSDTIMISFYQHITKIQDHRHCPCSFPNFKETRLSVVSLDHIGGIWLDTNTYHKSHLYESKQLRKYFSICLMKQLLNQQKIAIMI